MSGIWSRILSFFGGVAEDVVDAGIGVADTVLHADKRAYRHMLWQMREEAGSTTDAWAGPAHDGDLQQTCPTARDLLDAKPHLARYRASDNGEGPLFWAAFYGPLSLVERLVSLGADVHATTKEAVLIWFDTGMSFIPKGCTPLMMAAAGGQTDVVRYLLDQGVPADAEAVDEGDTQGHTALFMAARGRGTADIVRMLVEAGAEPPPSHS